MPAEAKLVDNNGENLHENRHPLQRTLADIPDFNTQNDIRPQTSFSILGIHDDLGDNYWNSSAEIPHITLRLNVATETFDPYDQGTYT